MGLNHFAIAAMIALLGTAPVLHAETATQPASPAAEVTPAAPSSDPALQASPIAGSEPAAQPAAAPVTPTSTEPSATTPETPAPAQTKGDVLTVPKQKPTATKKKRASSAPIRIVEDGMPGRGASMSQVEKHFGQPREKVAPVGQPPITRWIYSDYTVYFEHEYVIHSVRNDGPAAQQPVAPDMNAAPSPAEPAMQPAAPLTQPVAPAMEPAAPAMEPVTPETAAPPAAGPASRQ